MDVLEITNSLDIEGFLMTVDIDKTFASINHSLIFLKKTGFESEFINWIKIIIKNLDSCFIKNG